MKSWYYFLLPGGAQVAYKGEHVGEALADLTARTGYTAAEVQMLGSRPIIQYRPKPDYERMKRGIALGFAALNSDK